jgi:phosphatidate cytidylyltransferase
MDSLVSWWLKTSRPDRNYLELRQRVRTWWLIVAVFLAGVLFNRYEDA